MALTQSYGVSWTGGGANQIVSASDISGDTAILSEFSLAASTTNQEQQFGFDVANIKAVLITADGAVTLKTNSTGSPDHTKTFPSGGGELFWTNRSPDTNPFGSTDITTTYWTNAGASAVAVKIRILLNA